MPETKEWMGRGFSDPGTVVWVLVFDFSKQVQLPKECVYLVHCDFVMVLLRCVRARAFCLAGFLFVLSSLARLEFIM